MAFLASYFCRARSAWLLLTNSMLLPLSMMSALQYHAPLTRFAAMVLDYVLLPFAAYLQYQQYYFVFLLQDRVGRRDKVELGKPWT